MLLRSLQLRNIRSYTEAHVAFPDGMTLLAGDIGSGKSTLLLGLEFALFGIRRGEISGGELLRHGCRNGSVTLDVEIGGKNVVITRSLKRTETGFLQDAGTLTVDGISTELTAQELKARILSLLQYPQSLLTKGNLFRYTVYTPQEEMKSILFEKPEERLGTLRNLFEIDRYQRARERAALLLRELRREEQALKLRSDELSRELKDERHSCERLDALRQRLVAEERALQEAELTLKSVRASLDALEQERFSLEELKKQHAILVTRIEADRRRLDDFVEQRIRLKGQLDEIERNLTPADADEELLTAEERKLDLLRTKLREEERAIVKQESAAESAIARSEELIAKIDSLTECPTCRQAVDEGHKERLRADERRAIADCRAVLAAIAEQRRCLTTKQEALEKKRDVLLRKQKLVEANKEKLCAVARLQEQLRFQTEAVVKLTEQLETERRDEERRRAELVERRFDEERYGRLRKELDEAHRRSTNLNVVVAELKKDAAALEKEVAILAERRAELTRLETRLQELQRRIVWLEKGFTGTVYVVEKSLFHSIHSLFNDAFRTWFSMLLEDETITARLDGEFTPVLVQNGYETRVDNLSGGERTSVALAYRLALTKAVNEFLGNVQSKDLLILDEPTDGFSSEQLDRVREVLSQLSLRQILIVSHEPQMEGYVDHVLRVQKREHESRVA